MGYWHFILLVSAVIVVMMVVIVMVVIVGDTDAVSPVVWIATIVSVTAIT
jgi:hypothetical protein